MRNHDPAPITYAELEDKEAELDRLRAELEIRREAVRELNAANHDLIEANGNLRAENALLRTGVVPKHVQDENDHLRAEVARLNDLANAAMRNQGELALKLENDRLRAQLKDRAVLLQDAYAQRDRLREENERLTAIIANVCLSLGYEESAWPANWERPLKETER